MKLQEIRNATIKLTYAGITFLIDPWLAPRGANGAFGMGINTDAHCVDERSQDVINPMCGLPLSTTEILSGVDVHVITHLHFDHIDISDNGTVGAPLDKTIPVIAQNSEDAKILRKSGFTDIRPFDKTSMRYQDVSMTKTPCRHGLVKPCGNAMGIIFQNPNEPTVYLAGDTIWYEDIAAVIAKHQPDVIILNCCGANLLHYGRLIMNEEDLYLTAQAAPDAKIIAVHMDTISHGTISRHDLRIRTDSYGLADRVFIPEDGETLTFS